MSYNIRLAVLSLQGFPIHDPSEFYWNGRYVAFTDHANLHLDEFNLDAIGIIDMLQNPIPCPKYRRFKKREKEICSRKHGMTFRIILFEDYCADVNENCWVVKNVKPA